VLGKFNAEWNKLDTVTRKRLEKEARLYLIRLILLNFNYQKRFYYYNFEVFCTNRTVLL
jgi:hypothetical protein